MRFLSVFAMDILTQKIVFNLINMKISFLKTENIAGRLTIVAFHELKQLKK